MPTTTIHFELQPDASGKLTLHRDGAETVTDVSLRRAFPWSAPEKFVSVRNSDGKEVFLIEDPGELPASQRRVIEEYLASAVFIPRIRRVLNVDVRFGYQQWSVETDKGPIEFRVQEREDIRFLPDGRFTIRDADGNLYELPPIHLLDTTSQRAVESLL